MVPKRLIAGILYAAALIVAFLLFSQIAHAAVALCTISGQALNGDGSPDANDTITIMPNPTTQIINGVTVTAQPKSVQTDANGNLTAFSMIQNLNVLVTFHNNTAAPIVTFVPNATSSSFAQFLAGTLINAIPEANGGLEVTGSIVVRHVGTPAAPTVTVNTTGATSYTYFCVAEDFNFDATPPSAGTTIGNGAATPNNIISCGGQTGALHYLVLKTNTSSLLGACATLSGTSCSVADTGQTPAAYTPVSSDNTGSLYFDNNSPIWEKDTGGTYRNLFSIGTDNILHIGGTGLTSINFDNPNNIGSTFTSITLQGATSGQAVLSVPSAAGTPATFRFPSANGSAGAVLTNDGTGATSWGSGSQVLTTGASFTTAAAIPWYRVVLLGPSGGGSTSNSAHGGGGGGGGGITVCQCKGGGSVYTTGFGVAGTGNAAGTSSNGGNATGTVTFGNCVANAGDGASSSGAGGSGGAAWTGWPTTVTNNTGAKGNICVQVSAFIGPSGSANASNTGGCGSTLDPAAAGGCGGNVTAASTAGSNGEIVVIPEY